VVKDPEVTSLEKRLREIEDEREKLLADLRALRQVQPKWGHPSKQGCPHFLGSPAASRVPATSEEKVALFLSLFRCRQDVFPRLWENARKGIKGYAPACRNEWLAGICRKPKTKCSECPAQAFLPLDENAVDAHLRGRSTIGTYAIRKDDTCVFLACDFDGRGWQDDAAEYRRAGMEQGVDVAIERSRSGNGAHAWIFFSEPIPAKCARELGTLLLAQALDTRPQISFRSYDRFLSSCNN
jgi:hypothetical protein